MAAPGWGATAALKPLALTWALQPPELWPRAGEVVARCGVSPPGPTSTSGGGSLKRVDSGFAEIDTLQATAEIGEKLKRIVAEHGPEAVAVYVGVVG